MSTVEPALRHAVGFYTSAQHLVEQTAMLVRTALAREEPVVLALQPATDAAVRRAIGSSAIGSSAIGSSAIGSSGLIVSMGHPDGPAGRSGQTLAADRARELRRLVGLHGPATMISEYCNLFDGPDGRFWTELDAAANIAMADVSVHVTCFFPEAPAHCEVLDGAWRNHALLLVDDELRHNPEHREPGDVLAQIPVPSPPDLRSPDVRMTFGSWQLIELRSVIETTMLAAGVSTERVEDVSLAVNEVATNAVQHGAEQARFCMWSEPDGHVFEIHDQGTLGELLPGLRAPQPAQRRHRGLWIARQLCDALHIWTDGDGTHVRVHATA